MNFITRLNEYIEEVRSKPFTWGSHDCFVFSNTAFNRMYGKGYADDWLGIYTEGSKIVPIRELKKEYPYDNLKQAIDDRLTPKEVPTIGDLVMTKKSVGTSWYIGSALGICIGNKAAFVGLTGLKFMLLDDIDYAWGIK